MNFAHASFAASADHARITPRSHEVHPDRLGPIAASDVVAASGDGPDTTRAKGRSNVINKLLGAAAMAAITCAFLPAHAARVGVGCSGDNLAKVEGNIDTMADGPAKFTAQREIAAAQDAMLKGSMSRCAMHLGMAMRNEAAPHQAPYPGTMAQAPYPAEPAQTPYANTRAQVPYANTRAEAPADTNSQTWSQPHWDWKPIEGPR
jgi:hypothetical protein